MGTMLTNYKILTVTHKRTNLKAIGEFVIKATDGQALRSRLEDIKSRFQLDELLYLPTCNRVMYFFTTKQVVDEHFAAQFFQFTNPNLSIGGLGNIHDIALCYEGEKALEHLLDVAASVDSLVVGERQILRQVLEAYE